MWLDQFIVSGKKIQNSEIFNELQIYFAISLFEADKLNEKSFDILEKQFKNNNSDQRTWIPLYFLGHTLGRKSFLLDLLNIILPSLKEEPKILENYP